MTEGAHSRGIQLYPVHLEGRLYQEFPVGTTTILVSASAELSHRLKLGL